MITWLWLIPAFLFGCLCAVLVAALCSASRCGDCESAREKNELWIPKK